MKTDRILSLAAWGVALGLAALALYLGAGALSRGTGHSPAALAASQPAIETAEPTNNPVENTSLPGLSFASNDDFIVRRANLHTLIPSRPRTEVITYTVSTGDSIFEIALNYGIKPETVLWANYDLLNDNPDFISLGMELKIPPVDGVYYQWKGGDSVEAIASRFEAKPADLLAWSGNDFDLTNPVKEAGTWVMVPGGRREFRQWIIPTIPRGRAGVSSNLYGPGTCEGGYEGAFGTGTFVWPADNHNISGNDYWDGHLAIDIAAGEGAPLYAADSGVVVFSGVATGGYGYMVMIDHGNGYQTLYAHMSSITATCGRSVTQGGVIGYSGSTGNSTGPHLHFEVRYLGGFVSPWFVLP